MLVSHLQKYYGSSQICVSSAKKRMSFLGRFQQEIPDPPSPTGFHYCEYYYACRQHPCTHDGNKFQKSHDFDLNLTYDPVQKYLIQYRNPLSLLISWFEMRLLRNREVDSADGFLNFVDRNESYVRDFQEKWMNNEIANRLLVDYESYISAPVKTLSEVIHFFGEDQVIDEEKIQSVVKDVKPAKDDRQFRFYQSVARRRQLWISASSSI